MGIRSWFLVRLFLWVTSPFHLGPSNEELLKIIEDNPEDRSKAWRKLTVKGLGIDDLKRVMQNVPDLHSEAWKQLLNLEPKIDELEWVKDNIPKLSILASEEIFKKNQRR